jgi:hypothetical protein
MNLVIVVAPHFVAGLLVDDTDRVMRAAPILGYMRGWEGDRVRSYVKAKGWRASRVVNGAGATVGGAANVAACEDADMQQWPNQPDPNQPAPDQHPERDAPGAPHTPDAPRQTPQPGDDDGTEADV